MREAQQQSRPLRPIWTKIETRFSQEANTQPEIPCMQRWAERFQAVNDFQPPIEGMIANWYHQGFYPTPVTELFGWLSYTNPPPVDDLLRAMARRDFGPGQEELGRGRVARLLRGHLALPLLLWPELSDERGPGPAVLAGCEGRESPPLAPRLRELAGGDGPG